MLASHLLHRSVVSLEIRRQKEIIDSDPEARTLAAALDDVSRRLGTSSERPDDTELACQLGHKLRNQVCGLMLRRSLSGVGVGLVTDAGAWD